MMMYKKNTYVFWVQTDEGMLLQNVHTNLFIELDKMQEKVWEYLDGTFTVNNIVEVIAPVQPHFSTVALKEKINSTIDLLQHYDMINKNEL